MKRIMIDHAVIGHASIRYAGGCGRVHHGVIAVDDLARSRPRALATWTWRGSGASTRTQHRRKRTRILAVLIALVAGACTVGPDYMPPGAPVAATYKELKGWKIATPRDDIDRGAWWSIFHDPTLDALERQVDVSNQNLAAAEAAYRLAAAMVQEARAQLFPTVNLVYNPLKTHTSVTSNGGAAVKSKGITTTRVTLEATGTWDIDVWGRIRRMIESDIDLAQASAADIANARLSAQAQLAVAYFDLRAADSLASLLQRTIVDYKRTQQITENQYDQGTVARSDVIQAQTQVRTTEAAAINVGVQRAQFEHAIAILMGRPPAEVTIKKGALGSRIPLVPPGVPSVLLERRPDIAAAERRVAAQGALIGVAVAAYFPDITLSGFYGWVGPTAFPISAANQVWQIAANLTETAIDGGLRRAQVAAAESSYYQAVATYRQAVLTAFQQVEDALSTSRILAQQQRVQDDAVRLSRQSVEIALNEYRAGQVSFTTVTTTEATLLSNEEAALTVRQNRFLASVNLIQALGGGWDAVLLPDYEELGHRRSCVDVRGAIRGNVAPELPPCL
jgi:NodT family efflux transporter outer membrane factor (OMF) lipoprotein